MIVQLLCVLLAQSPVSPVVETPPVEVVVEHDPYLWHLRTVGVSVTQSEKRVRSLTGKQQYEELATELAARNAEYASNRAVQIAAMSWLVGVVANTQLEAPELERRQGRTDPRLREICRPYVESIVLPELSIPANPELLEAQYMTLSRFLGYSTATIIPEKKSEQTQRAEYIRRLILVWTRMIKTCLVYRDTYTEEVLTREVQLAEPPEPKLRNPIPPSGVPLARMNLDNFKDPADRKLVAEYAQAVRTAKAKIKAARETSRLRKDRLSWIRDDLVRMYGEDRTKWDELRQIVTDTVKDPDIAQLVLKDFTQRKETGVWPTGPKPEPKPAPPSAPPGKP
jgi:hypothetical protein